MATNFYPHLLVVLLASICGQAMRKRAMLAALSVASVFSTSVAWPSYIDNGDGTATDTTTGLMWEVKDTTEGSIHSVEGHYIWTSQGQTAADGSLFTVFLATLNTSPCFAGYCDWRIPTIQELLTLVDYTWAFPAISPSFPGPTAASYYWSSTSGVFPGPTPYDAWVVNFDEGVTLYLGKNSDTRARAVRGNTPVQCNTYLEQCEADLTQCITGLTPDQDGDGEVDGTDACPDTPAEAEVDQAGCALAQFCAAIDATTALGAKACKNSDWRNDEPLAASNKGDCRIQKGNTGRADDLCVPRL